MITEEFKVDNSNIVLISEELPEWLCDAGINKLMDYTNKSDNNIIFTANDKFGITKDEFISEDVISVFDKNSSVVYQVEKMFNIVDRFCLDEIDENSMLTNGYLRLLHLFYFIKNKDSENKPFDVMLQYYFDGLHEGIIGMVTVYIVKHFCNVRKLYILDNHPDQIECTVKKYEKR